MFTKWRACSTAATSLAASGFKELALMPYLCDKLSSTYNIKSPTTIQRKCLVPALEGKHVVANAETGSGKTLCFLLPILQRLIHLSDAGQALPSPLGLVMVPTPDLGHQISRMFQDLSKGYQFNSNVAFSDHPLLITKSTHLVVATPTKLCQYDFKKALRDVQFVCFDEADSLFCGGHQKASWDILKTFAPKRGKRQRVEEEEGKLGNVQLILTAATLPSKTPKSVGYLLRKCLSRETVYVDTDNTHQVLSSSQFKFKRVTGTASSDEKFDLFMDELLASGNSDDDQSQKVLVFCNTVENVEQLHDNLMKWSSSSSSSDHWWSGKVGLLHKLISPEERLSLVQKFNANELKVLISTDVSSRGLDIPDISSVFMYDFPTGTVDFLHRAGRTARAGKPGKVISFVTSTDEDLARAIEESIKEGSTHTNLSHLFSRNKMLRRKFKRQARKREVEMN